MWRYHSLEADGESAVGKPGGTPPPPPLPSDLSPPTFSLSATRLFVAWIEPQGRHLWGVGSVRQMNIVVDRVGAGLKNQDPRLLSTMLPVFRDAYPDIVYR